LPVSPTRTCLSSSRTGRTCAHATTWRRVPPSFAPGGGLLADVDVSGRRHEVAGAATKCERVGDAHPARGPRRRTDRIPVRPPWCRQGVWPAVGHACCKIACPDLSVERRAATGNKPGDQDLPECNRISREAVQDHG